MRVRVSRRRSATALSKVSDLVLAGTAGVQSRFRGRLIGFDTEGTGLIPYGPPAYWGYYPAAPFAFSFCDTQGHEAWIRKRVNPINRQVLPGTKAEEEAITYFLGNEKYIKVGHNIGYDRRITEEAGYRWAGEIHDTMVLAHVATAGDELSYALKPLCKKYLNFPDDDEKKLEDAVRLARYQARAQGYLIAGGKKEVERGDRVVFAGSKPVKADYWLVPSPESVTATPHDLVRDYGVGDAARAILLFLFFYPIVEADPRLLATYRREMQGWHVLRNMERRGTRVYPRQTDYLIGWYSKYMVRQRAIADVNGGWIENKKGDLVQMNFNSSSQLMRKFYEERGHPIEYKERKNKKTGETKLTPTFGKDQLAVLGATDEETGLPQDQLAKAILEWRSAKQTITAFLNIYRKFWYPEGVIHPRHQARYDKILKLRHESDGRVTRIRERDLNWLYQHAVWVLHPNYNQTGAVTGRMTCSDPNLQQVASATTGLRKSDIPQRPRECFGPRPGCIWYLPDYSQIEVWVFAWLSGDREMQRLLLSGYDFHQGVADRSFTQRDDYEARKKYYRKLAKLIMFGKLYGGGVGSEQKPGRMTRLLQMPFHEAKAFIDSFEEQFAGVKDFMDEMVREAKKNKEAWNLFGRKYALQAEWAYKIVNYLVQGSSADILKLANMRVDWLLKTRWSHPRLGLINSIHDELMIEVPLELHSTQLQREIAWVMQMDSKLVGVPVPLPVGMKTTKPQYIIREREWMQRWSDTEDSVIRRPREVDYWLPRNKVGGLPPPKATASKDELKRFHDDLVKFKATIGGVPYLRHERAEFAELAVHMGACPYNNLIVVEAK